MYVNMYIFTNIHIFICNVTADCSRTQQLGVQRQDVLLRVVVHAVTANTGMWMILFRVPIYIYTCSYVCIKINTHVCVYVCICIYVNTDVYVYKNIFLYIHI